MDAAHEPWLVVLSLFVAFQGSYVGLHLARGLDGARGLRRRQLITTSALSLALGVWTMHFVGMLAIRLPMAVDFLVLPTLISFLVCVLVVGFAVFFAGDRPSRRRIGLAALSMGAGIVTMHYLGMYALHAGLHMTHDPAWVAASIVVGIAASGAALWFGFGAGAQKSLLLSAAIMALAISAMHYTAMAGVTFHAHEADLPAGQPALSPGLLAVVVSVVAFLVSGLFLLTLVPEPEAAEDGEADGRAPAPAFMAAVDAAADEPEAGTQPRPPEPARSIPVEKDGLPRQLDVGRLVAVQAQGHYTQLFDGEATWFCPLTISEVEALLDPACFARVHRSHIVRLDRIASLRKSGDAGQIALATRVPYRVPVARSRRSWLVGHLRQRATGAAE